MNEEHQETSIVIDVPRTEADLRLVEAINSEPYRRRLQGLFGGRSED